MENDGDVMLLFFVLCVSSFPSPTPGNDDRAGERTKDYRCMARNNGARGMEDEGVVRMDSRTNGALLLLPRRLVAGRTRPVEILRFVVARKNPEDWLKEEGQRGGGSRCARGMRATVTSGFVMRRLVLYV